MHVSVAPSELHLAIRLVLRSVVPWDSPSELHWVQTWEPQSVHELVAPWELHLATRLVLRSVVPWDSPSELH